MDQNLFHKVLEIIIINICKLFPIKKQVLLFRSRPDFSDNARALAEYLVENNYTTYYDIYFDVESPQKYKNKYSNSPITFFSSKDSKGRNKFSSLKLLYTANYLLSTHDMIINRFRGRRNQHYIRLWHGCGYKDRSSNDGKNKRLFDIALVPGPLFVKTKSYFWNVDKKFIVPIGYPRYNWLFNKKDERTNKLLLFLNKNQKTKIVIWMPTYRVDKKGKYNETKDLINFPIVQRTEDWISLDDFCEKNNIVILVKLHPFQKEYDIPFASFHYVKEIDDSIFEEYDVPLYRFLSLTDALITDYSSVAFDYLLVDKPIGFTLDDYSEYKDKRGFIFENPLEYMPGHHLYSINDMISFLDDVSKHKDIYKEKRDYVRSVAITPSSDYCRDILDYLNIKLGDKLT